MINDRQKTWDSLFLGPPLLEGEESGTLSDSLCDDFVEPIDDHREAKVGRCPGRVGPVNI